MSRIIYKDWKIKKTHINCSRYSDSVINITMVYSIMHCTLVTSSKKKKKNLRYFSHAWTHLPTALTFHSNRLKRFTHRFFTWHTVDCSPTGWINRVKYQEVRVAREKKNEWKVSRTKQIIKYNSRLCVCIMTFQWLLFEEMWNIH